MNRDQLSVERVMNGFTDPMPRLSVSAWRRGLFGFKFRLSGYSIAVVCPCCGEHNYIGTIQGERGKWKASYKVGSRYSRSRNLRGTFPTVRAATRAILEAKGQPPLMFRS